MTTVGNFDLFAAAFPNGMVSDVIELMLSEWKNVASTRDRPLENRITNRFAGHLTRVMRLHDKPQFRFTCRPKLANPYSDSEIGEIDVQVTSFSPHPDAFLVIECKCLNVESEQHGFSSQAGKYVGEGGMGCFISNQYDSGGDVGVMFGYVMTRTISAAMLSINEQLKLKHDDLGMAEPYQLQTSSIIPDNCNVRETMHTLADRSQFRIVHAFVSYNALSQ